MLTLFYLFITDDDGDGNVPHADHDDDKDDNDDHHFHYIIITGV